MIQSAAVLSLAALAAGQASSYAPTPVACPDNLITRTGNPLNGTQSLGQLESEFRSLRRGQVLPQLYFDYINDASTGSTGYIASQLFASNVPVTGIACSGGGFRAALYCAGSLSALDKRNSSTAGGLLQMADYLTGLSGGSWAVSSIAMNDLPPIYDMVLGTSNASTPGWLLDMSILDPGGLLNPIGDTDYISTAMDQTMDKAAVTDVSVTDLWGRLLSTHFWNGTTRANFFDNKDDPADHDAGLLWSSIRLTQNFQAKTMPFPIIVTTSRVSQEAQDQTVSPFGVVPFSNTQFSIDPFTFGSFDPTLAASIPLDYAGSLLNNGVGANATSCMNKFDNAGFMIGSSASIFNAVSFVNDVADGEVEILDAVSQFFSQYASVTASGTKDQFPTVANWPNSFMNFEPNTVDGLAFETSSNVILQITDGGLNGENLPLAPLLVKARAVDFILALDASKDTDDNWPNATSLVATYERVAAWPAQWASTPPIPTNFDEIVSQGLNTRPVFFGCDATQADPSALGGYPIIAYLPNAPPPTITSDTYLTNTSTFQPSYQTDDVVRFLDAAHANALKGLPDAGEEADADWALCLKCATVDRLRQREAIARSSACQSCFDKYCAL